jgi:hypothetical protein
MVTSAARPGQAAESLAENARVALAGKSSFFWPAGQAAAQVTGAADWHINADEPDLLDYDTSFKPPAQDAMYEPNAYRSSDHDPVVVGLSPREETPPALSVTASPSTLSPPNHKYTTVNTTITATDNSEQLPRSRSSP